MPSKTYVAYGSGVEKLVNAHNVNEFISMHVGRKGNIHLDNLGIVGEERSERQGVRPLQLAKTDLNSSAVKTMAR